MQTSKLVLKLTAAAAGAVLLAIHLIASQRSHGQGDVLLQKLYNQWGTNDHNDHWGGVGSENYHTAKYDKTGWNEDYHPRDSASGDGVSMEPAWWRNGPGANSEVTGHAMDGELYDPPHSKVFKPFFMKQKGNARTVQLYDADGPSPLDKPRSAWVKAGHGTTYWMLNHEGPLLASQQEIYPEPPTPSKYQEPRLQVKKGLKAKALKTKGLQAKHVSSKVVKAKGLKAEGVKAQAKQALLKNSSEKDSVKGKKGPASIKANGLQTRGAVKLSHAQRLKDKILAAQPSKQG